MMTEIEIRDSVKNAMNEPKAPEELIEKGLQIARAFEKALAEQKKPKEMEVPHTNNPFIGGSSLMM